MTETPDPLSQKDLFVMRTTIADLFLDPKLARYIVDLIQAARNPAAYDKELAS